MKITLALALFLAIGCGAEQSKTTLHGYPNEELVTLLVWQEYWAMPTNIPPPEVRFVEYREAKLWGYDPQGPLYCLPSIPGTCLHGSTISAELVYLLVPNKEDWTTTEHLWGHSSVVHEFNHARLCLPPTNDCDSGHKDPSWSTTMLSFEKELLTTGL